MAVTSFTPCASSRFSQARSSGEALITIGKTPPDVPMKVSVPRPEAHAFTPSGVKASSAVQAVRCGPETGREMLVVLGVGNVEAGFSGEQEFSAKCRHAVIDRYDMTGAMTASPPPSGPPVRRR